MGGFSATDNLEHFVAKICIRIGTDKFAKCPILVFTLCTANMLLPPHFYRAEKSVTLCNCHTNVAVASIDTLNTVQDMVSIGTLFSIHHVAILSHSYRYVKPLCCFSATSWDSVAFIQQAGVPGFSRLFSGKYLILHRDYPNKHCDNYKQNYKDPHTNPTHSLDRIS